MNNQERAFKKLSRLKVGALFMEMGTGKTKVALDLMAYKSKRIDYFLWICPLSLKDEIQKERDKWQPDLDIDIVGCESIGASVRIYSELLDKVKDKRVFMVVDESLKIKNIRAKRTQRIIKLGDYATYKLILNGTPVSRSILDMWTQMEFLSGKILQMSYNEFKNTYCEYYQRGKLKGRIRKQHNIPHLISRIKPYIFDCELDIDTKKHYNRENYFLDSRQEYDDYKYELFDLYSGVTDDDFNFKAFSIKLQQFYTTNSNIHNKIEDICNKINDRVIVYVKYLAGIPEGAHSVTGKHKTDERKQIFKDFEDGKFNVLYITYGCGSFGLNLQFCKHMIFAQHSWDYAQRIQAEARIYRMGQGRDVYYYDMLCYGVGLEDMIQRCLSKKTDMLDEMKQEIAKKGGMKEWVKSI